MNIEFNDNLLTGNSVIDAQHRELIGRIAALVKACEEGGGKVKAVNMLDYLAGYTKFHFADEERLQIKVSYPGYEEHRAKHEEFKKTVEDLHQILEETEWPTGACVEQVKKEVVDWLVNHIEKSDRALADYINDPNRL